MSRRPKKTESRNIENGETVSAGTLATILDCTPQKVSALHGKGRLPRKAPNQYPVVDCIRAYLNWLERDENSPARRKVRAEAEAHRRDLLKAQAELMRRKCDRIDQQFIARAEVEAALAPIFSQWEADAHELTVEGLPDDVESFTVKDWKQWAADAVDEVVTRARYGCEAQAEEVSR